MRRPSFQFYPRDWLSHMPLRMCSPAARALWIDMMCLMHDGQPYGHLSNEVGEITTDLLARCAGLRMDEIPPLLAELERAGIFSRTEHATPYSPRMVRDGELSDLRAKGGEKGAEHGKKGGRPSKKPLEGVIPETPLSRSKNNPPSSSSSSSSSAASPSSEEESTPKPPSRGLTVSKSKQSDPIEAWWETEYLRTRQAPWVWSRGTRGHLQSALRALRDPAEVKHRITLLLDDPDPFWYPKATPESFLKRLNSYNGSKPPTPDRNGHAAPPADDPYRRMAEKALKEDAEKAYAALEVHPEGSEKRTKILQWLTLNKLPLTKPA